jgi:hypothetical protein
MGAISLLVNLTALEGRTSPFPLGEVRVGARFPSPSGGRQCRRRVKWGFARVATFPSVTLPLSQVRSIVDYSIDIWCIPAAEIRRKLILDIGR